MRRGLHFGSLLVLVTFLAGLIPLGAPAGAAPPAPLDLGGDPPRIVHHRPGQLPKYESLQVFAEGLQAGRPVDEARNDNAVPVQALLASGTITDPMAGNYRVVPSNQLAVLFDGGETVSDGATTRPSDTFLGLDMDTSLQISPGPTEVYAQTNSWAATVSADLAGHGIDVVAIARSAPSCLSITVLEKSGDHFRTTGDARPRWCETDWNGTGQVALARGYFFDGATRGHQLALGWMTNGLICIRVVESDKDYHLTQRGVACGNPTGTALGPRSFRLAAGDVNGDGGDEVLLTWVDGNGTWGVHVLSVNQQGQIGFTAARLAGQWSGVVDVAIAAADFRADGSDEIGVAINAVNRVSFLIVEVAHNLSSASIIPNTLITFGQHVSANHLDITIGSFLDAAHGARSPFGQVAIAYGYYTRHEPFIGRNYTANSVGMAIIRPGKTLNVGNTFFFDGAELADTRLNEELDPQVSLTSGTMNLAHEDLRMFQDQIALGWTDENNVPHVRILDPNNDCCGVNRRSTYSGGGSARGFVAGNKHITVVAGDFVGRSVRLGPPTYRNQPNTLQVQAMLAEPPQHVDLFGSPPITINVNYNNGPFAGPLTPPSAQLQYKSETGQSTNTVVAYGNGLAYSLEFAAKYRSIAAQFDFSLKRYGSADFDESTTTNQTTSYGRDLVANSDTMFVYTQADYDTWEYPVLDATSTTPTSYVTIAFPRKNPLDTGAPCLIQCYIKNGVPRTSPARNFPWQPDHEAGNVLSFRGIEFSDVLTPVYQSGFNSTSATSSWTVRWNDSKSTLSSTTLKSGVDLAISGGFGPETPALTGARYTASFTGKYTHSKVDTKRSDFDSSTGFTFSYPNPFLGNADYQANSHVYWSRDGFLRVNWEVDMPTSTGSLWATRYSGKPDLAFNLRWRPRYIVNAPGPDISFLTPDLRFFPPSVSAGQPVTIVATIRNYSLTDYAGAPLVRLYDGDPTRGGVAIGEATVGPWSHQKAEVTFHWTPRTAGVYNVWATINPRNTIEEIHRENNSGFQVFTVRGPGALEASSGLVQSTPEHGHTVASNPDQGDLTIQGVRVQRTSSGLVEIVATVSATGSDFANVTVDFFDGDPRAGGRHLGTQTAAYIPQDGGASLATYWPATGVSGTRAIFAEIRSWGRPAPAETNLDNNIGSITFGFGGAPKTFFIPAVPEGTDLAGAAILPAGQQSIVRRRSRLGRRR